MSLRPAIASCAILCGVALSMGGSMYVVPDLGDPSIRRSISGADTALRGILLFVTMLLGMYAETQFHKPDPEPDPGWRSRPFAQAVLVAPIVFFAVFKVAQELPDGATALLLAFQNGFFWRSVLAVRAGGQQ